MTIVQVTERVKEIRIFTLIDLTTLIRYYPWDINSDLRLTSIKALARLLTGLNVSFIYLSNPDQKLIIEGLKLPFEDDTNPQQYLGMNEMFLKIGYVSSLYFIIERTLRSYLQFLDTEKYNVKEKNRGNIKICECLLEELLIYDIVRLDSHVFKILRLIRNSLHNNGIHA